MPTKPIEISLLVLSLSKYVLIDNRFAAKENFEFILKKNKHFVAGLKDNRLVAFTSTALSTRSLDDKKQGRFIRVSELELLVLSAVEVSDKQAVRGWLKGFDEEILLVRRVFTNQDGSTATLNLVCSDLSCDGEQVATLYLC